MVVVFLFCFKIDSLCRLWLTWNLLYRSGWPQTTALLLPLSSEYMNYRHIPTCQSHKYLILSLLTIPILCRTLHLIFVLCQFIVGLPLLFSNVFISIWGFLRMSFKIYTCTSIFFRITSVFYGKTDPFSITLLSFIFKIIFHLYVCLYVFVWVCAGALKGKTVPLNPLKQELQAILPMWEWKQVLSARAAHALMLNHLPSPSVNDK